MKLRGEKHEKDEIEYECKLRGEKRTKIKIGYTISCP
jgi:hypothetical protein